MKRNFYKDLIDWKNESFNKPLFLLGARQVGKTFLINEFIENEFKFHTSINLFHDKFLINLYDSNISSKDKFDALESYVGIQMSNDDYILFVDEVQESESFISDLKYIQENRKVNIICAGSLLGVKLKRFKQPFPVSKIIIKYLYPLNFEEFLLAIGKEKYIDMTKECFASNSKMIESIHNELLNIYYKYLFVGGMPESVYSFVNNDKNFGINSPMFFATLIESYLDDMKKYVSSSNESLKIEKLYKSIPMQQTNLSHKFQYSKIKTGGRGGQFESSLNWLLASGLVYKCLDISKPEIPLKYFEQESVFKLFINDVGVLSAMLELNYSQFVIKELGQAKGYLAESFVAQEMVSNDISINYWRNDNFAEVDFVVNIDNKIIPIEVKSSGNTKAKSLLAYIDKYNPDYSIKVSTKNFGYVNGIKSIPLYAVFCLNNI
jgi:predicted AAA+ superfamily ATPase